MAPMPADGALGFPRFDVKPPLMGLSTDGLIPRDG
jgi:hypothetical protein